MNHPSASAGFEWRERAACLPHPTVLFFGVDDNETAVEALKRAGGVQVKAAELLGMSFRSFRYYVKKYNLR